MTFSNLLYLLNKKLLFLRGEGTKSWTDHLEGEGLRYLTYFGMCLSTCIIFQSSTSIAALVGLCVAVYISVSEYTLNNSASNEDSTLNN